MKLGIIGVGAVGSATAMAAALRARVREIVLIDLDRARAKAVATDMHYGVALSPLVSIRDGDYADLADAGLAIITAGVNEKAGGATDRSDPAGRLRLLDANVKVFQDLVPKLVKAAPQASARVGGMPVRDLLAQHKIEFDAFRKAVEQDVRFANITIIEGIGASQYGIGMVSARVAEVILRDERAVFPAGSYNPRFGTTVSLPSIVGRQGVIEVLEPAMSDEEKQGLERSAARLKETVRKYLRASEDEDARLVCQPPGPRPTLRPCGLDPGPAGPCGHQILKADAPADPRRHGFHRTAPGPLCVGPRAPRNHLQPRPSAGGLARRGRGTARRSQRRPQSARGPRLGRLHR
jgi:malate/lactate dehydrogenase